LFVDEVEEEEDAKEKLMCIPEMETI